MDGPNFARVKAIADAIMERNNTQDQMIEVLNLFTIFEGEDPTRLNWEEKSALALGVVKRSVFSVMRTAVEQQAEEAAQQLREQSVGALRARMGVE